MSARHETRRADLSRESFTALAAEYRAIPVSHTLVADLATPLSAFMRCVGDEPGFLLESAENGERWSRFSFIGRRPHATLVARGNAVEIRGTLPDTDLPTDRGILVLAEELLGRYRSPLIDDLPPLNAGLVGYFSYDVVREIERLPDVPEDDTDYPDAVLDVVGDMAVYDHWRQRVTLIAIALLPPEATADQIDLAYDDALARLAQLATDGARALDEPMITPPEIDEPPAITSSMGGGMYQRAVEVAKEYIVAGDIFQVVLAQRYAFDLEAEPLDVYRVLRQINPSPHMYFLRQPEVTLVGCSPEPLVQVVDGRVIS